MASRRDFMKRILTGLLGFGVVERLFPRPSPAASTKGKTVIPKGTKREDLVDKNPKDVDGRNLEITPLKDFGTMGLDDYKVNLDTWRLIVDGDVSEKLSLTYSDITEMPAVERKVLLICPGVFVNNGLWKGISVKELFKRAGAKTGVNHVTLSGPEGNYEKALGVPLKDVQSDKVFLAYEVNGKRLPVKHGFPLRVVAEGYYGYDWVKYVYKVTAKTIKS